MFMKSSMAYHIQAVKDSIPFYAYALTMSDTITERIVQAIQYAISTGKFENQTEIAKASGVSKQALTDWIKGRSRDLKPHHLFAFADACGIEPRWLATGKGPMHSRSTPPQDCVDIWNRLNTCERKAFVTLLSPRN